MRTKASSNLYPIEHYWLYHCHSKPRLARARPPPLEFYQLWESFIIQTDAPSYSIMPPFYWQRSSFPILPGSDVQANDFHPFCRADVNKYWEQLQSTQQSCICRGSEVALGSAQDPLHISSPAVPLGKLWAPITGPLKKDSVWPLISLSQTNLVVLKALLRGPRDLRVCGFLFPVNLDLYLACYQMCLLALWAQRDYFPAQVLGNLVLGTSHQLLGASFWGTETAFVLFQKGLWHLADSEKNIIA